LINLNNKKTQQKTKQEVQPPTFIQEIKSLVKLTAIPLGIEELHNNVVKFIQLSKREAVERDSKNEY
jgi:hypothetical protein